MRNLLLGFSFLICFQSNAQTLSWIRINQLGYTTKGIKTAIWCSKENTPISKFELLDSVTGKLVYSNHTGRDFGSYGPFSQTFRLDFSKFTKPGKYYVRVGEIQSPVFRIDDDVYKGAADFCLQYMRQQRSGFNPFLKDTCHTHDGYVRYGAYAGIKDSTHIDVVGGWHDASDYLQYSSTSANAVYHLLMAYRDFPKIFKDEKQDNGLDGQNGRADVLDEAKWGLDWLIKMHPQENLLFNQLGDDRDHAGMRIPKEDSFYGKGYERPVYLVTGEPQQRGKFMNNTTGTSSTAAKFASAFALGYEIFYDKDKNFAELLFKKSRSANAYSFKKLGVTQTVSIVSPYIYAEDNWVDDMELSAASYFSAQKFYKKINPSSTIENKLLDTAFQFAQQEPITPWLGKDTAKHYQWYPFINLGHYELAKETQGKRRDTLIEYYRKGIDLVWQKAKQNAFYRAIPFIWCSNNLTVAFAQECYWYRQFSKSNRYTDLEQANFDWLFGCNPWGTSMVYGLPAEGDYPIDPHSALSHLKNYPLNGGLVDGPVYTAIYKNLIGITLTHEDTYKDFQSDMAVYHDDYGDYSTNEPTMDGTASLIYLLAAKESENKMEIHPQITNDSRKNITISHGALIRGDSTKKDLALVFTADEFGEGIPVIMKTLTTQHVPASFFFTGRFYKNPSQASVIKDLYKYGFYLGPHSNEHLLYCDWGKRDSTLIDRGTFVHDLNLNKQAMEDLQVLGSNGNFFIPPYEWWNDDIAKWCHEIGYSLVNFTPGSGTNADYTYPEMGNKYKSSAVLIKQLKKLAKQKNGLNGYILLIHAGTDPKRSDKLYNHLGEMITFLKAEGYGFKRIDQF
ncbi:MAG: glycoside hydrolase family 9 protein [Bacteroidetes bacterium]|nr:glycoside hydrolase family 9 protein [Bacteroidota bacterium]